VYNPAKSYTFRFNLSIDKISSLSPTIQYNNISLYNPTVELYDDISDNNKIIFSINPFVLKPVYSLPSQFVIIDNNNKWNYYLGSISLTLVCINNIYQCKLTDTIRLINFTSTNPLTLSYGANNTVINTFKLSSNSTFVVDPSSILMTPLINYKLPTITLTNIKLSSPDILNPLLFNNITITPQYTDMFANVISNTKVEHFNSSTSSPSHIIKFKPITTFPRVKNIYLNIFKPQPSNMIDIKMSDLGISGYKNSNPRSLTIGGSLYFLYDVTIPIDPYFYCNLFSFKITDINVTDKRYTPVDPLNPNLYYIRLTVDKTINIKNSISKLIDVRIYLSTPTPFMIKTPNLMSTILYTDYTYVTIKPLVFDQLYSPLPTFISKYVLSFPEKTKVLSETYTGFDIFGQFNISTITTFPNSPNDIYKILYVTSVDTNPLITTPYNIPIWSDRFITPVLSDASLGNQSVLNMHNELQSAKFYNFTDNIQILSAPYKYSSIFYQYTFNPYVLYSIIKNGFDPSDTLNTILDYDQLTIKQMKIIKTQRTELNDNQAYVGLLYCNSSIFDSVASTILSWPKNAFECNIAFYSYITYQMYKVLSTASSENISKKQTDKNIIKLYKITTPFRKNTPFVYRIDILSFLHYLSNQSILYKLLKYNSVTSTQTMDLPTAMILAYYDKNPQDQINSNAVYSAPMLLSSYIKNQSVLSRLASSVIPSTPLLNLPNMIENFTIGEVKKERVNTIHMKYALL
jgi:hypothetical protein